VPKFGFVSIKRNEKKKKKEGKENRNEVVKKNRKCIETYNRYD